MELWLQGALALLQGGAATGLSVVMHRSELMRGIAAGVLSGLVLCHYLPEALRQCSSLVMIPALVLGVILSVFLRESTTQSRRILWGGWLMLQVFLQIKGALSPFSLPCLLPAGIALGDGKGRLGDLWLILPMLAGLAAGHLTAVPLRWQGLLLSLGCGMLLQGINIQESKFFAGGIAIGVILSFI